MRYKVKYTHPDNGSLYYFVDFRLLHGKLSPLGCHPRNRNVRATIFESKLEASKVVRYLFSIGCDYVKVVLV